MLEYKMNWKLEPIYAEAWYKAVFECCRFMLEYKLCRKLEPMLWRLRNKDFFNLVVLCWNIKCAGNWSWSMLWPAGHKAVFKCRCFMLGYKMCRKLELIYAVACRITWICPMTFDNFPLDVQVRAHDDFSCDVQVNILLMSSPVKLSSWRPGQLLTNFLLTYK